MSTSSQAATPLGQNNVRVVTVDFRRNPVFVTGLERAEKLSSVGMQKGQNGRIDVLVHDDLV